MSKNDGGPAFPLADSYREYSGTYVGDANGMSLRDYFAANAPEPPESWHGGQRKTSDLIEWRWAYADYMLKAREA